jgi:hypothetical protein
MYVYYNRKATTQAIYLGWLAIRNNADIVAMYGADLIGALTEIVTPAND